MIRLGNKIELHGFQAVDPAQMVVVRKMIGNLAKKLEESKGQYEKLEVVREPAGVKIIMALDGETKEISAEHQNLFFAINEAFKQLEQ